MKTYFICGFLFLIGCGSTGPARPVISAPVVIPKPTPSAIDDGSSEPIESSIPAKPRVQVAIGDETVCLRFDGSLRCWKRSEGAPTPILSAVPAVPGLGQVTDVSVGMNHVCTIVQGGQGGQGGQVYCWGHNQHGQIGAGRADVQIDTPVHVEGINGATAIVTGMMHSCVLLAEGRVSCWGWNADGQVGGDVEYAPEARVLVRPEIVPGISGATQLAAGRDQTCVRMKNETWCWGRSYMKSQLDARGYRHNQAAKVEELADLQEFGFSGETACGLFKDAHVGCWGSGAFSMIPSRPLHADSPLPVILPPARHLSVSKYHGCAILQDGKVSCWGGNVHGELGRPPQPDYEPKESGIVQGLPARVDALAVGSATSCAIVHNQELWCWGIGPHQPWVHGAGSEIPVRVPIEH